VAEIASDVKLHDDYTVAGSDEIPSKSKANGAEALSRTVAAANRVTVFAQAELLVVDHQLPRWSAHRDVRAYCHLHRQMEAYRRVRTSQPLLESPTNSLSSVQ
jgi:hypothetical protein